MNDTIGALGDIVTGAAVSRAVGPGSPTLHDASLADGHSDRRCLNCGHFLVGPFCDRCGQRAHVHRSVGAFGHDFLHSVLHFEGKMWRTLPMLFWRPGELTRRYINGERARFFSPLALFLFAVFLTFGVFSAMGSGLGDPGEIEGAARAQTEINQARVGLRREVADTETALAAARAANEPVAEIARLTEQLRAQRAAANVFGLANGDAGVSGNERFNFVGVDTGVPEVDALIEKGNDNPSLMLYKIQGNAYKFAWALIPLSAPFLWLLYPFSRRFAIYDHLVFVTFSLSFMLLLAIVLRIAAAAGVTGGWIGALFMFYPPLHMYRQLRGAYRSSRIGALVRTMLLLTFATLTLTLFMAGLLALGALG